jgi:hypothetical protein
MASLDSNPLSGARYVLNGLAYNSEVSIRAQKV